MPNQSMHANHTLYSSICSGRRLKTCACKVACMQVGTHTPQGSAVLLNHQHYMHFVDYIYDRLKFADCTYKYLAELTIFSHLRNIAYHYQESLDHEIDQPNVAEPNHNHQHLYQNCKTGHPNDPSCRPKRPLPQWNV